MVLQDIKRQIGQLVRKHLMLCLFLETVTLLYVALMTFILIVSSVTMVLAVEAAHRLDKKGVVKWLLLTVVGGLFFVGSQAWEWYHFIHGTHFGSILTSEVGLCWNTLEVNLFYNLEEVLV